MSIYNPKKNKSIVQVKIDPKSMLLITFNRASQVYSIFFSTLSPP